MDTESMIKKLDISFEPTFYYMQETYEWLKNNYDESWCNNIIYDMILKRLLFQYTYVDKTRDLWSLALTSRIFHFDIKPEFYYVESDDDVYKFLLKNDFHTIIEMQYTENRLSAYCSKEKTIALYIREKESLRQTEDKFIEYWVYPLYYNIIENESIKEFRKILENYIDE